MSDLIIVAFPDEATAFEAGKALVALQKEYLIEMEDVVVVTREEDGKVHLHQAVNLTTGGAIGGGLWGALIGLLFLNPIVGAAVGAGAGALAGRFSDIGIDDDFLRNIGQSLDKGGAAVGVLVRKMTPDKVLERLEPFRTKGRVLHTSLSRDAEAKLKAMLEHVPPLGVPANQLGGGKEGKT
ncbi:MAG: DUF1269 domain-containing protein [Tabrizicola sp.]|nr:DUF1269 domain-containing protein [Tabrizicola sp.]